jgi:plastocyanin
MPPEHGAELPYPARRAAIAGDVSVRTSTGAPREDRSGVVVFLDGGPPSNFAAPAKHARISQRDRRFEPHVLPIVRGTTVDFPNDDVVYHNVFSLSAAQPFDLGTYRQGSSKSVPFTRCGLVRVYCNLHPQMASSILVLANPYFTLTDNRGSFVLPEVPDGEYELRTWSEFGGEAREKVQVRAGELVRCSLAFQEEAAQLQHDNKFGHPYREKY